MEIMSKTTLLKYKRENLCDIYWASRCFTGGLEHFRCVLILAERLDVVDALRVLLLVLRVEGGAAAIAPQSVDARVVGAINSAILVTVLPKKKIINNFNWHPLKIKNKKSSLKGQLHICIFNMQGFCVSPEST